MNSKVIIERQPGQLGYLAVLQTPPKHGMTSKERARSIKQMQQMIFNKTGRRASKADVLAMAREAATQEEIRQARAAKG